MVETSNVLHRYRSPTKRSPSLASGHLEVNSLLQSTSMDHIYLRLVGSIIHSWARLWKKHKSVLSLHDFGDGEKLKLPTHRKHQVTHKPKNTKIPTHYKIQVTDSPRKPSYPPTTNTKLPTHYKHPATHSGQTPSYPPIANTKLPTHNKHQVTYPLTTNTQLPTQDKHQVNHS